ncbi:acyl-CoA dehydrogenase family protein [Rhodococcus sp. X156]|uniref:acyl-CoA dehydrogenase family protein n=1 Tax=Rhodococcus sp. X156 TaxID=2499145 RepID=UPI000FD81FFB|nr:acyl-CoA dehydrogenase family protein [Rhodococcus sp. X156]
MDFSLTDAQQDLGGLARQILTDKVTQERLRAVETGPRWDQQLWADLATAGVLSAALPEQVGGGGFGLLEQCSVLVELGRAVAPVPYLQSVVMAAAAIAELGTDSQRERWAAPAAAGELVLTVALVDEPGTGGTRAQRSGDGWVLNGAKSAVSWAPVADAVLVAAATDAGPVVLLVRSDDPGVQVQDQQLVDGGSAGLVELTDVRLDADRVLGTDGEAALTWLVDRGTVGICALQLGVTERALELTAEYARERVQFGRPIGSFQAVAQRLADAYIDVEAIRLTLWQAAWRLAEDLPSTAEVATAKFWAADAGHRVSHTAVHVHGGVGIDTDHALHRYFTAAKRNEFELGAATAQLLRLGATLAAEPA